MPVRLRDGREYSYTPEWRRGPLPREELIAKYTDCAQLLLGREDNERSINLVESLEEVGDATELANIVVQHVV